MNARADSIEFDPAVMDPDSPEFQALLDIPDDDAEQSDATNDESKQDVTSATTSGADETVNEQKDEGTPVVSPDGKGFIPYGVLKGTRQDLSDARRMLEETQARLQELESKAANSSTPKAGQEIEAEIDATQKSIDDFEELLKPMEEDFPEFGKSLRVLHAKMESSLSSINERLAQTQTVANQVTEDRQAALIRARDESIDNNAHLSLWRSDDIDAWNLAAKHDERLRNDAEWRDKPFAERFAKVVQYTLVDKPDAKRPATPNTKDSQVDTDARVRAALEGASLDPPASLSHIPSGEAPVGTDMTDMSPVQLEAMMEKMTPDQIGMFLAKLG